MWIYTFYICTEDGDTIYRDSWVESRHHSKEELMEMAVKNYSAIRLVVGVCSEAVKFDFIRPDYVIIRNAKNE